MTTNEEYDYRVTAILTEHFGYPPLTVVDDVINAVNHILYKCTQAMESYLGDRINERKDRYKEAVEKGEPVEELKMWLNLDQEINMGNAKLETLLEHQVDKNFDKFELYALRNIFTIPKNLIDEGYIRLKHHENIQFNESEQSSDEQINKVIKDIKMELKLREILKLQITKGTKLVKMLRSYNENLKVLKNFDNNKISDKSKEILRVLNPIEDNLYFILTQINDLISQINKLFEKFEKSKVSLNFKPNLRDFYINGKSYKLLQEIGIEVSSGKQDVLAPVISISNEDSNFINDPISSIVDEMDGTK